MPDVLRSYLASEIGDHYTEKYSAEAGVRVHRALSASLPPSGPLTGASARTTRYTVADLRQALAGLPGDAEVVIGATCDCEDGFEHDIYDASYTAGLLTIDPV